MHIYLQGLLRPPCYAQVSFVRSITVLTFLLLASGANGWAQGGQTRTISGVVTDAGTGETLPGVNIIVSGTTSGTVSNMDGEYSLQVSGENAVLVFSFIGYIKQEVGVGNQNIINVSLDSDAADLEEVVVVGYGTVKKRDLTGSVERSEAEAFQNQTMRQLTDMLTGPVAGFNANQSTSAAGGSTLEVRGTTCLNAGTTPMIVLDGVVYK